MRIISGKWRGRKLVSFDSKSIRPTMDRVKETIFNMIGPDVVGTRVLDLFSGTGSLGFEALSRGAESVVAVDNGFDSKKIMKKNKELLGEVSAHTHIGRDVLQFVSSYKGEAFDFILIDPPFTKKMGYEVMKAVEASQLFHEDSLIFIEYVKGEKYFEEDGALSVYKVKNYGDKLLYSYTTNSSCEA